MWSNDKKKRTKKYTYIKYMISKPGKSMWYMVPSLCDLPFSTVL